MKNGNKEQNIESGCKATLTCLCLDPSKRQSRGIHRWKGEHASTRSLRNPLIAHDPPHQLCNNCL